MVTVFDAGPNRHLTAPFFLLNCSKRFGEVYEKSVITYLPGWVRLLPQWTLRCSTLDYHGTQTALGRRDRTGYAGRRRTLPGVSARRRKAM